MSKLIPREEKGNTNSQKQGKGVLNERTNKRTNEQTNEQTNKRTNKQTNEDVLINLVVVQNFF